MKEIRGFDMLENAKDTTIERLSGHRVLTDREKRRLLDMSKKKMNDLNRESIIEDSVSGVEPYKRPKWHGLATVAASLLLVGGIVGGGIYLGRNGQVPDAPMKDVTATSETTAATEEYDFSAEAAQLEADNEDMLRNAPHALADRMLANLSEYDAIMCGTGVDVDADITENVQFDNMSAAYSPVTDERFTDMDSVKSYFYERFTQNFLSGNSSPWEGEAPMFMEMNGRLWFRQTARGNRFSFSGTPETSFDADSCTIKADNTIAGGEKESITVVCKNIKSWDNTRNWKVDSWASSEASLIDTADDMMMKLNQFVNLTIGWGVGEDKQVKKTLETSSGTVEYYRCYDFEKPEDVKARYREYFTEDFLSSYEYLWNEDVVETPIFKVFDGKLYHRSENIDAILYSYTQNDIQLESYNENRLEFTVSCKTADGNQHMLDIVCVREGGDWKTDSYSERLISSDMLNIPE